jgi:hypothetical protein
MLDTISAILTHLNASSYQEPIATRARVFAVELDSIDLQMQATSETKRSFSLGLSKQLALTALLIMSEKGWPEDRAIAHVWRRYGELAELNTRTLKKCVSEAQALVAFIRSSPAWDKRAWRVLETAEERLVFIEAALRATPLRDALAARQAALGGSKGGRPRRGSQALDAVVDLVRRAKSGERNAESELAAVRAALSAA